MPSELDLEKILSQTLQEDDIDSNDLDLQEKTFKNFRYQEDTKSRKKLAYWAAAVVTVYLLLVFSVLGLNTKYIQLAESVLLMLLGTTTLNVLGLMYIVLKGYFKVESERF